MQFIAIDTETSGLNKKKCQVLEFGAVLVDTDRKEPIKATFRALFLHDTIMGEPYALNMNKALIAEISDTQEKLKNGFKFPNYSAREFECFLVSNSELDYGDNHNCFNKSFDAAFNYWLTENGVDIPSRLNLAGKNIAMFDLPFLETHNITLNSRHRFLDPAILYTDLKTDKVMPDLKTCLQRAGLPDTVSHTAVDDAMAVAKLICGKLLSTN